MFISHPIKSKPTPKSKSIPIDQFPSDLIPILSIPTQIIFHPINSHLNQFQSKSIPKRLICLLLILNRINSYPMNSNPNYFSSDQLSSKSIPTR